MTERVRAIYCDEFYGRDRRAAGAELDADEAWMTTDAPKMNHFLRFGQAVVQQVVPTTHLDEQHLFSYFHLTRIINPVA